MSKPNILVARSIFPETIARLEEHFDVESNQSDESWSKARLIEKLKGKQGVFTTGSERIDAEVLDACPDLKICANMAVGYNNFDVDAMTARGVLATNAPDVLTETTADFGFALMMATARRIGESERFVRQGEWTKTGDKYSIDASGCYVYAGRSDDMLKVSGIYVSPFEVEATLVQHPAVLEAAVIGALCADGLTRTKAYVVLRPDGQASEAELQDFVKDRLAPYKYPRLIEFVPDLPKTATGKIQRFKLREREATTR